MKIYHPILIILIAGILLSACQTEPAGVSPAETQSGRYAIVAKGIELNESTGNVDPGKLKADFGIVYGGIGGEKTFKNVEANILSLEQANIPCLLLWDIRIPEGAIASNIEKTFPPENEEANVAAILRVTKNLPVNGVIIRFEDKKQPDGKEFTQGWMANYIQWMVSAVYHQTGKPLFVMTSQAFIKSFGEAEELNRVVSGLEGMSSWKAMWTEEETLLADWVHFPIPADDYVPEYISNNPSLSFINYARKAYKFNGIDAASTPLWIYTRPVEQLRKDLDIY